MNTDTAIIHAIRASSRDIVRELGFMQNTLAATDYSASAVHTLLELDMHQTLSPTELVQCLGLEKSSISRMLAKLVATGEIEEQACANDTRVKNFSLTEQGQQTVQRIHAYGQNQVQQAFQHLNGVQQQAVAHGLSAYAEALKAHREGGSGFVAQALQICHGYQTGLVGRVTEMHAEFYARHCGFGPFFESQVATGMAAFVGRLHESCNQVWTATLNGRIVGSVSIDGQDLGNGQAHLRWFILDENCRGGGIGRQLLSAAMDFVDAQGFAATQLWTFQGLDAARKLYESHGFELTHEALGTQWGSCVKEQQFTRLKPAQ